MENLSRYKGGVGAILIVLMLMLFIGCRTKQHIETHEKIELVDTTKQIIKVLTKDSTHVNKKVVITDSVTRKEVIIEPKGEFTWNPSTGFKGEATKIVYVEDERYKQVLEQLNLMITRDINYLDSLSKAEHAVQEVTAEESKSRSVDTPFWVWILLIVSIAYVVYRVFRF